MDNTKNIWHVSKYLSDQMIQHYFFAIARIKNDFGLQVTYSEKIRKLLFKSFFFAFALLSAYYEELLSQNLSYKSASWDFVYDKRSA